MTWLTVIEYLCHKWPRICSTCRKHFPVHSSSMLITGFVTRLTRRVSLVEQELLTLLVDLSSPPVFSGVRVARSLGLCMVCRSLLVLFVLFLLAIVSVLFQFADSDYPFGVFKLFFHQTRLTHSNLITSIFFINYVGAVVVVIVFITTYTICAYHY